MKNFILATLLTGLMSIFYSCSSPAPKEYKPIDFILNAQDTTGQGYEVMNYWSFVPDSANPANKYSQIDSTIKYGIGLSYKIPDSLVGTELSISLKFKAKETQEISSGMVVCLQPEGGQPSFYTIVDLGANMSGKINEWVTITSEVIIDPLSNDNNNAKFTIYSYKPKGGGRLLIDDISVSIKAIGEAQEE